MDNKKLPKSIKSTITNDVYYLTFEERESKKGKRYLIHYTNYNRKETYFLVESYSGYDYEGMYECMHEDINWKNNN